MPDLYACFADLAAGERQGRDYRIEVCDRGAPIAIVAPHGGAIESGTSEVARTTAGGDLSLYLFEGRSRADNSRLHITSTRFDEPEALRLIAGCDTIVTIHGRGDRADPETVWVSGRDRALAAGIAAALEREGFRAGEPAESALAGTDERNICNRGRRGKGVQLELPRSLRRRLTAEGPLLAAFAAAVRGALPVEP